jgi:hypothetical protein
MSFTPKRVVVAKRSRKRALDHWQRRAVIGMFGLVAISFLASNAWARIWQHSDWLVATVLPAVVVELTNEEREGESVPTLRRSAVLDEAATKKAEHMAAKGYFAHYSPTGVSPWHWFTEVGYEYVHAGENLAVHFTDSSSLVAAWMNSPTHRDNIVGSEYTEIGVGIARGTYQGYPTVFVVQMFGTPVATTTPNARTAKTVANATPAANLATTAQPMAAARVAGQQAKLATSGDSVDSSDGVSEAPPSPRGEPDAVRQTLGAPASSTAAPASKRATSVTPQSGVWYSTGIHSTSSGTVASQRSIGQPAGSSAVALATQPQRLLQWSYGVLSVFILGMMVVALRSEFRRHQYIQMAYSIGLLVVMVGLWYIHGTITTGAVIL